MTLLLRTPDGADLGRIDLRDGKLVPVGGAAAGLARTALLDTGNAGDAYASLNGYDNGYVLVGEQGIAGQAVGLAAGGDVTVTPKAMKPPGIPVPDDPAAISMFTAHRVNSILHQVAHATERMQAAKTAAGDLRKYHVTHIAEHLQRALDSAREMTENLREHYPAEAAELEQVKETIGLAAQALGFTGDGHGHHVAGTPDVYSHGWKPVDGTAMGEDGILRPSGGSARARPADIHAILAQPVGADVKKDTAPLFEGKYGDFAVKVDSAQMVKTPDGGKAAEVNASIYNEDGRKVGVMVRGLYAGQDGARVHNVEMLLSPKYQGHGFASEFTRQTEARLKAAGVKHADLHANQDVGGYAWARKGFDWANPGEGQQKVGDLASWYKSQAHQDPAVAKEIQALAGRARKPASEQFPTPFDLSRVGYAPGASTWPGKEFLLSHGWDGTKKL
jgi:hypothetical protein